MIKVLKQEIVQLYNDPDAIALRVRVKSFVDECKMSIVRHTMLATATSELSRNMMKYGKGGEVSVQLIQDENKKGIKLIFRDRGPGIENIQLAMTPGYSSSGSLGLGLSGAKKLVDVFDIRSKPKQGTTISILKWT